MGHLYDAIGVRFSPAQWRENGCSFFVDAVCGEMVVGRVYCERSIATQNCYVTDIFVDEAFRRKGLATNLLCRSLVESNAINIVPVSMAKSSVDFWLSLLSSSRLSVKLTIDLLELKIIMENSHKYEILDI